MSEDKKCSTCGNTIPEGKDNCEHMQCSYSEIKLEEKMGEE